MNRKYCPGCGAELGPGDCDICKDCVIKNGPDPVKEYYEDKYRG